MMETAAVAPRAQSAANIAGMLAVLGAENDKFRHLWANADEATRRMLLQVAKKPLFMSSSSWDELSADTRGQIKRRAADLQQWLNRVLS